MKTSVTIRLDADLLRNLKVLAARRGQALGDLVAEQLEFLVGERRPFSRARRRALARLQTGFDLRWVPASRNEVHKR